MSLLLLLSSLSLLLIAYLTVIFIIIVNIVGIIVILGTTIIVIVVVFFCCYCCCWNVGHLVSWQIHQSLSHHPQYWHWIMCAFCSTVAGCSANRYMAGLDEVGVTPLEQQQCSLPWHWPLHLLSFHFQWKMITRYKSLITGVSFLVQFLLPTNPLLSWRGKGVSSDSKYEVQERSFWKSSAL